MKRRHFPWLRSIPPFGKATPTPFSRCSDPECPEFTAVDPMPAAIALRASRGISGAGSGKSLELTAPPPLKPHRPRPPAHPPHIVGHGRRLSAQGQRKASAPGTEPIAPGPQPLQAKGTPQRVPPCAWISRRLMGKSAALPEQRKAGQAPSIFQLGGAYRVCYTPPMNSRGIAKRWRGWQGRSPHFRVVLAPCSTTCSFNNY